MRKIFNREDTLDERQEQELLRIEHNGYWLAFFGLLIIQMIQQVFFNATFREIAGELILLLILAIYMVADCLRHGIWDRYLRPSLKTNAILSFVAAAVTALFVFTMAAYRFQAPLAIMLPGAAISAAFVFLLCFLTLQILSKVHCRHQKKMEEEHDE